MPPALCVRIADLLGHVARLPQQHILAGGVFCLAGLFQKAHRQCVPPLRGAVGILLFENVLEEFFGLSLLLSGRLNQLARPRRRRKTTGHAQRDYRHSSHNPRIVARWRRTNKRHGLLCAWGNHGPRMRNGRVRRAAIVAVSPARPARLTCRAVWAYVLLTGMHFADRTIGDGAIDSPLASVIIARSSRKAARNMAASQSSPSHPRNASRPRKRFTLEQANSSLPLVTRIVRDIVNTHERVTQLQARLEEAPVAKNASAIQDQLDSAMAELQEYVEELGRIGIELKDYEAGLVDFPGRHQGRDIFLCWRMGEEKVLHWHELHTGFAGRLPISKLEETR